MRKYGILIMVFMMLLGQAVAQHGRVVSAEGEGIDHDVQVATRKAIYSAKQNALMEAGVAEDVRSTGMVLMSSDQTVARQHTVSELSMLMLDGQVHTRSVRCDTALVGGMVKVTAKVKVEVRLANGADPEFRLRLSGLNAIYREGERVRFQLTPSSDCYLRIFWFSPIEGRVQEGGQLYPLEGRYRDRLFHADSTYHFPHLPADCLLGNPQRIIPTNDGFAPVEYNVLFVVATKRRIAYDRQGYTYEEFMDWLWSINATDRVYQYALLGITK